MLGAMTALRTYLFAFCAWAEKRHGHPALRRSWRRAMEFAHDVEPLNRHLCIAYMVHCLYVDHYRVVPDDTDGGRQ